MAWTLNEAEAFLVLRSRRHRPTADDQFARARVIAGLRATPRGATDPRPGCGRLAEAGMPKAVQSDRRQLRYDRQAARTDTVGGSECGAFAYGGTLMLMPE